MKNTITNKKNQQNMQKNFKKISKAALKSGSSSDIADYINRLFDYSQKFNIDFSTLDYQRHLEKIFSMNDEEKIYDFMINVVYILKYEKSLVYTLIDLINKYYNGNISAEILTILINVDDKARDLIGKETIERNILNSKDPYYAYFYAKKFRDCNTIDFENIVIDSNNAKYIEAFARNVKGANIDKLLLILFELKAYKEAYNVLLFMEVDKKILKKYIKQFMLAGQVKDSIELIELYLKKFKKVDNKNMIINQLIEMNLIDKRDIDDYLINVPVDEQKIFKDNILESDNLIQNSLLESKNKNSSVNETDLIYDNCIYDGSTPFPNTSSSRLKLINLSLVYYNVLPSVVKDFKEVRENVELYLDLLKKCDEKKYYYYKNAFEGKISFEQADSYYKYYLDNLVYDKTDLCDDMHNILKLKYSKNKEQKK